MIKLFSTSMIKVICDLQSEYSMNRHIPHEDQCQLMMFWGKVENSIYRGYEMHMTRERLNRSIKYQLKKLDDNVEISEEAMKEIKEGIRGLNEAIDKWIEEKNGYFVYFETAKVEP